MHLRYTSLILTLLCALWTAWSHPAQAQETDPAYRRVGLRFGINAGGAWQTSDVRTIGGGGVGATIEVPIVENDHSFFGVGLRGRYLWTATYGRDWQRKFDIADNDAINGNTINYIDYTAQGSYFANHRTSAHNWDLELMLKLNRLRVQTGILAYIWGGVGAMGYSTKLDQGDLLGMYDYSNISGTKQEVLDQLWALRDGDYDVEGDQPRRPHWRFTPSVGVGLGYEFAPWFQLVAEYKVSFPLTDALDGTGPALSRNWRGSDIHHYAGLGLHFGILGGSGTAYTPPVVTDPNTYTPRGDRPAIVMVYPTLPNTNVGVECYVEISARLYNVRNKQLIIFTHDGATVNPDRYNYDPESGMFSANMALRPGVNNNFRIVARNSEGTVSQDFSVICENMPVIEPQPTGLPPQVYITYPQTSPAIITGCRTVLYAEVLNVRSKDDIAVYHYGRLISPQFWEYNSYNNQLTLDAQLEPGANRFEIVARNPYGEASASTVLTCPTQIALPTVEITAPSITPYSSPNCVQAIVARVTGVRSRADVQVYVNRQLLPQQSWSYSPQSQLLNMTVSLIQGQQTLVEIIATNENGQAADLLYISCYQQLPPPVVEIITPPGGNYDGQDCNQHLSARVLNVSGPQDITVTLNGSNVAPNLWSYNTFNQLLIMDVQLIQGSASTFIITARNSVGQDADRATLKCSFPPAQMITICHIPPGNPAGVMNITIPEDQWPAHKAHGDVRGPCATTNVQLCYQGQPVTVTSSALQAYLNMGATQGPCQEPQITICHIPPGNPAAAATVQIPQSAWASHQAHGDIQGPCSPKIVSICYNGANLSISETVWPTYQSLGATQGPCPLKTVTICHIPPSNPAAVQTLTIPEDQWPAHKAHGDVQGPCSSTQITICHKGQTMLISQSAWAVFQGLGATQGACPEPQITICHIPPKNPAGAITMTIAQSEWASHQAHGDVQGACSTQMITVCYNNQTIQASQSAWPALQAAGATQGACPPAQITICHIPPGNPTSPQTITIPATEWSTHQAHGDVQGACSSQMMTVCYNKQTVQVSQTAWPALQALGAIQGPCPTVIVEKDIQICHFPPGNPANPQTLTIPQSAWAAHQAHGDIQGPCSTQMITVCYNNQTIQVSQSAWNALQAAGATQGPCKLVAKDIQICHIPPGNPGAPQTLTIAQTDWPSHQAHGDVMGACSPETVTLCFNNKTITVSSSALQVLLGLGATEGACPEPMVTICHVPPGNPGATQTMTVPKSELVTHLNHGDLQGPCSSQMVTICYRGKTLQISQSALTAYQNLGASQGACPEPDITICHIPPGNPANPQTLTIPANAWAAHQGHGDIQGPCSSQMITVCYNNQTIQVSQSAWSALQAAGATQGACPEPQITICHIPPGNPANPQNLTIPANAWAAHQAHGDVQGPCSSQMITVCYENRTIQVSQSAWSALQAAGATQGACPEPQITICHIPPGNPTNPQTLNIPQSAWSAHQSHGDILGACSTEMMAVCYNNHELQVSVSAWSVLQSLGALQGECPQAEITICHIPPGNPTQAHTLTIGTNAWSAHQEHGDVMGPCSSTQITVCLNGNTYNVTQTAWPVLQAQGATQGPCPRGNPGGGNNGGGGTQPPVEGEKPADENPSGGGSGGGSPKGGDGGDGGGSGGNGKTVVKPSNAPGKPQIKPSTQPTGGKQIPTKTTEGEQEGAK